MSLEVGIVGLPNVGKSTIFNALTAAGGAVAANYPFATIRAERSGVVAGAGLSGSTKSTNSSRRKDHPGGAARGRYRRASWRGASTGEGLGNKFLSHIREVDAILHVVRCFAGGDVIHVEGSVDPIRDIDTIDTELAAGRSGTVSGSLDKAERTAAAATRTPPLAPRS